MQKLALIGLVALTLVVPSPRQVYTLLDPSSDTGSGCQQCEPFELESPDGEILTFEQCQPAPFAAPSSGHRCVIEGNDCIVRSFCYFA